MAGPVPDGEATVDPLRAAAARRPDAAAVIGASVRWTYRELDAAADRVARRLAGAGVRPGDRVASLMPRGAEMPAVLHGVPRLGAALVPLHTEWTEPELDDYLRRVRPRVLLCVAETEALAAGLLRASGLLIRVTAGSRTPPVEAAGEGGTAVALEALPAHSGDLPGVEPDADHTVLATSGTSGRPRGVRLTLANHLACQRAAARRLELAPGDRWLASLSPAHVGGVALILRAAVTGSSLLVRRGFDAGEFLGLAEEGRITHASLVPVMLRRLLDARGERPAPEGLRGLLVGGASADPRMVERALALGWPLAPTYGLTEAASQVATATPEEARRRPGTVGRPLEGVEVTVRDGEIHVRGPTVAAGYLGDEKAPGTVRREGRVIPRQGEPRAGAPGPGESAGTAPGGVTDEDGWLHTGDAGRLDEDGYLTVTGRLGDRIVSGGVTVDPREVERVLEGHPEIRAVAVVGVPDPEWGERIGALVVRDPDAPEADPDEPLGTTELAAWFGERLAPAKRPRAVRFVDALPRNPNGKVDRAAARRTLREERRS